MTFGHEGGYALNEDQRGGHDEIGACLGALRGIISRDDKISPSRLEDANLLGYLDRIESEVKGLRERHVKRLDEARAERDRLRKENAALREQLADAGDDEWEDEEAGLSQPALIGAICKSIEKLGVKTANARQLNAIISAADAIMDALRKPHTPATSGMGLRAWLGCDETGLSSWYMAHVLAPLAGIGSPPHPTGTMSSDPHPYPHAPSDFARCMGLLSAVPELRPHLAALGEGHGPQWAALAGAWPELEALFEEEKGKGEAPKLYARMQ